MHYLFTGWSSMAMFLVHRRIITCISPDDSEGGCLLNYNNYINYAERVEEREREREREELATQREVFQNIFTPDSCNFELSLLCYWYCKS